MLVRRLRQQSVPSCLAAACLIFSATASSQVRPLPGGQALDANLQIGSGGINYPVPQNYTPNTGMVDLTRSRGLTAFQGRVPSLSNQLSTGVSTGGIERFRQQSVSLQDVVQGGPSLYNPQISTYNSPLTTFLRPSDILQAGYGRRAPLPGDQSVPLTKHTQLAEHLFVDATADFKPLLPAGAADLMVGNALGLPREKGGTTDLSGQWVRSLESQQIAERGGRDLFGVLREEDRIRLAREISEFDRALRETAPEDSSVQPVEETQPLQPMDTRLPATGAPQIPGAAPSAQAGSAAPSGGAPSAAAAGAESVAGLPQVNHDPFFDMLVQLRSRQAAETVAIPGAAAPAPEGTAPPAKAEAPQPALHPMDAALLERMKTAIPMGKARSVELTGSNEVVIHRLAGEADDAFNRCMRNAEAAMKAQRFYEAARQYSLASAARPLNPMSHLGGCLANFAAGEWMTAARNLRTAMELFPPLMETRLDLPTLVPTPDLAAQMDLLERWIQTKNDSPMLRFLAAFLERNFGRNDRAQSHAEAVQRMDRIPKILRAYARYVLTGQVPARTRSFRHAAESRPSR